MSPRPPRGRQEHIGRCHCPRGMGLRAQSASQDPAEQQNVVGRLCDRYDVRKALLPASGDPATRKLEVDTEPKILASDEGQDSTKAPRYQVIYHMTHRKPSPLHEIIEQCQICLANSKRFLATTSTSDNSSTQPQDTPVTTQPTKWRTTVARSWTCTSYSTSYYHNRSR